MAMTVWVRSTSTTTVVARESLEKQTLALLKGLCGPYETIEIFVLHRRFGLLDRSLRRRRRTYRCPNFNRATFSHRASDLDVGRTKIIHGQGL